MVNESKHSYVVPRERYNPNSAQHHHLCMLMFCVLSKELKMKRLMVKLLVVYQALSEIVTGCPNYEYGSLEAIWVI